MIKILKILGLEKLCLNKRLRISIELSFVDLIDICIEITEEFVCVVNFGKVKLILR